MTYIQNPKVLALVQTAFYGAIAAFLPALIGMISNGGIAIPYGLTGLVLVILNFLDNQMSKGTAGNFFGSIS